MATQNKNMQDSPVNIVTSKAIKLPWHPAFSAALRIEFEDELEHLHFHDEYCLGKEPMRMDLLIIKKDPDINIKKNIGRIFRTYNIIEYKSPDDYLSMNDFYKAYGYACFFQADTGDVGAVNPEEITITYVCYHYPKKMIRHLEKVRHIHIQKQEPGIFYLEGDFFKIQLLVVNNLSSAHNFWLSYLRNNIKKEYEVQELLAHYKVHKNSPYYQAVMNLILNANLEQMKEVKKVFEAVRELFIDEFKAAEERGISIGEERAKLTKTVFKLFINGASVTEIAKQCNVSEDHVREILE